MIDVENLYEFATDKLKGIASDNDSSTDSKIKALSLLLGALSQYNWYRQEKDED